MERRILSSGGRILLETRYDWRVELWTPEFDRRYLCGRDDIHLFMRGGASFATRNSAPQTIGCEYGGSIDVKIEGPRYSV